MPSFSDPYEIVWRDSATEPIVVQTAADADMATAAFHAEVARHRVDGRDGEIVVRHRRDRRQPILRQPLTTYPNIALESDEPAHQRDLWGEE